LINGHDPQNGTQNPKQILFSAVGDCSQYGTTVAFI
jgi:hypothetical protein